MDNIKIGIEQIGVHIPDSALDAFELGKKLEANEEFIKSKLGFYKLAKKDNGVTTSDLCVEAFNDLASKPNINLDDVGCVMVVTQNPDAGGIPHTSAIVHQKLGLGKRIACCDISLGCTGFTHASSIISSFMRENQISSGLLFTADPYSVVIDMEDRDTAMLFGDGATCTMFSNTPKYTIGRSRFATGSKFCNAIKTADSPDRTLSMVGSEVFRFVAKNVPKEIKDCLADNELTLDQVDQFLIHQGSKFIVETLATAVKADPEKFKFSASEIGNTVSSSIPLMFADVLKKPELPQTLLAAGFGVGLSSFVSVYNRVN